MGAASSSKDATPGKRKERRERCVKGAKDANGTERSQQFDRQKAVTKQKAEEKETSRLHGNDGQTRRCLSWLITMFWIFLRYDLMGYLLRTVGKSDERTKQIGYMVMACILDNVDDDGSGSSAGG